jgi:hypothetical protein
MKTDYKASEIKIHVPTAGNLLLNRVLKKVNESKEIRTLWKVINVNAIERRGMSDHGPVHFQIVSNIALLLARILDEKKVKMSIVKDFGLSNDHAQIVILLTSLLHDIGMTIDRDGHEEYSLFLTNSLLHELLDFLPVEERVVVTSEVLHAIISHRSGGKPKTIEAGIVRVADALDMSEGRSRIPYEEGNVDIYSLSAAAVDNIDIKRGSEKPIQVNIYMNNSAGLFQVDELLKKKIIGSGIEKYISVKAHIKRKTEKNLVKEFSIKGI